MPISIDMDEKFFSFANLPALTSDVIQDALTAEYEISEMPSLLRAEANLFKQTDFYKKFDQHFGKCGAYYLKNYPMMLYDWHIDRNRTCAVNWVIKSGPRSATFHRDTYQNDLLTKNRLEKNLKILFWDLTEIEYRQYYPTLIRTDIEHCIVNNDPEDRIILSLSTLNGGYEEVKDFLLNQQ